MGIVGAVDQYLEQVGWRFLLHFLRRHISKRVHQPNVILDLLKVLNLLLRDVLVEVEGVDGLAKLILNVHHIFNRAHLISQSISLSLKRHRWNLGQGLLTFFLSKLHLSFYPFKVVVSNMIIDDVDEVPEAVDRGCTAEDEVLVGPLLDLDEILMLLLDVSLS